MSDSGTALGPKFFVLGTYVQSEGMMAEWKGRGVNTLVQNPEGSNVDQWSAAAAENGMYMIRPPSSDLSADLKNPYLLAWAQFDEPSNTTTTLDYGAVAMDPKEIEAQAAPWRAAAAAEGKFMPVWANHVGGHIWPEWAADNALMKDYMNGSESDWLASDSYPVQGGQPLIADGGDYTSTQQGINATRQIEWSGGKSVMTFIGSSAYTPGIDVPTPAELKAQAWSAIINGSEGIIYFPVALSPWTWDATPPELVQAMTELHKEIASIDKILMNETTGGRDPFTVFHASNPGVAPKAGQLPFPFEATEIKNSEGTYRIILNLSDKPATLNKPEWGLNNATLQPYEVKKGYNLDGTDTSHNPTPAPTPAPEPTPDPTPNPEPTPDPAPSTDHSTITLRVSGDQYQGSPKFDVKVDGEVVAANLEAPAVHSEGEWIDLKVTGDFAASPKEVTVTYTNDLWGGSASADRNLYVDYIEVNGQRYEGEQFGYNVSDPNAATMFQDGTLVFNTGTTTAPAPTPTPTPTPAPAINTINGTAASNNLEGTSGVDAIKGYAGHDTINGMEGNDILTGGSGYDTFVVNTKLDGANNVDKITDFNPIYDTIKLENDVFSVLQTTGRLASSKFWIGAEAHDSSDRIIYNKDTGALLYDADGTGPTKAVQFATVDLKLKMTAADFHII